MDDLISRQAAIDACLNGWNKGYKEIVEEIRALPSVRPQQKIGQWEKTTDGYCYWYKCSCCGTKIPKNEWGSDYFSPYCPECGERKVEPRESEVQK